MPASGSPLMQPDKHQTKPERHQIPPISTSPEKGVLCGRLTSHPDGQGSMLRLTEGTSLRGTVFNLLNTMMGGGVLGLPYAVQQNGVMVGAALLALIAVLTDVCSWMLLVSVDTTREVSFAMVAEHLYGRWLGVCVDTAVLFNNLGVLVSYVIIVGDLVTPVMEYIGAPELLLDKTVLVTIITFSVLLPLSLLKSLGALRHASLVCLFMILAFWAIIMAMGSGNIDVSRPDDAEIVMISGSGRAFFSQMSSMVFAYSCLMNLPFLYGELRRKSRLIVDSKFSSKRSKMMIAIHISIAGCLSVYMGVGIFGYLAFHDRTKPDILTNLDPGTFRPSPFLKLAYSLVIVCSYPVMCFSCVASLHRLLLHIRQAARSGQYAYKPSYALSPAWSPRSSGSWSSPWSSPQSPTFSPVQETAEVWNLAEENAETATLKENVLPQNVDEVSEKITFYIPLQDERNVAKAEDVDETPSDFVRACEVACIVISTLIVGLLVPDISVVFSLTGGVCGGSITFIFPGLFFLKAQTHCAVSWPIRMFLGYAMLSFGACVSVATTAVTIDAFISG